jgi:hypothetical protein
MEENNQLGINEKLLEYDKKMLKKKNTEKALKVLLFLTAFAFSFIVCINVLSNYQDDAKRKCLEAQGSTCGSSESSTPFIFCDNGCKQPGEGLIFLLQIASVMIIVFFEGPLFLALLVLIIANIAQSTSISKYKEQLREQGINVE